MASAQEDPQTEGARLVIEHAFARMRAQGWQEAHDEFCDYGDTCSQHHNPHGKTNQ